MSADSALGGRRLAPALAAGLLLLVYLAPLGLRPLFVPDEHRLAEISREMLASGDWVVPRLDGLRYFEKPVLAYWCNAAALSLAGHGAYAVRLPAALSVALVAWILQRLARRAGATLVHPGWASLVYVSMGLVVLTGTAALIDPLLCAALAAALAALERWGEARARRHARAWLAAAGAACGLAFLAKGFLAFAVVALVALPFALVQRRLVRLLADAWIASAAALLVALPWSLAIHAREPDFWRVFFWVEHVQRFFSAEAQHDEAPWFFVPVLLGGALPWTFQLPAAWRGLRRVGFAHALVRLAWLWLLLPFLFFSASRGKLPTYVLPCFPALALLVAIGLTQALQHGERRPFDLGARACAALVALGALTLAVVQLARLGRPPWKADESAAWLAVVASLLAWSGLAWGAARARSPEHKLALFALGPCACLLLAPFVLPQRTLERKAPQALLEAERERLPQDCVLVADELCVHALCWTFERDDVWLLGRGELAYGLAQPDGSARLLDAAGLARLREENRGRPVLVVAKTEDEAPFAARGLEVAHRARLGAFLALELR